MPRVALIVALTLAAGPVLAEALPRPGRVDPRVRTVAYDRDNVTAIDATYGTSTMIELQSDERIETLALGDSLAWKVEPNRKGDIIFVKPVEKQAHSNLNVVTSKRVYSFLLRSNTHPPDRQIYAVRFRYPEDEADARLMGAARERARYPNLKGFNVANANSEYGYKGASANKPVAVFDDGTKTWFRFEGETPPYTSSMPTGTRASSISGRRGRTSSSTRSRPNGRCATGRTRPASSTAG